MSETDTIEQTESKPKAKKAKREQTSEERKGLRQIETKRRRREPLPVDQTESFKTRERTGWTPQSEPSGVTPDWWEQADR